MSHPSRRKLRLGRRVAKPYLAECDNLVSLARQQFVAEFSRLVNKLGSVEKLQDRQKLSRPQSKANVKQKTINVVYDLRESSAKYGKAYAFSANKVTVDKQQSRLGCVRVDGALALRISKKHGMILNLPRYGFRFTDRKLKHGEKLQRVWYGELTNLDVNKLLNDYPEFKGLI